MPERLACTTEMSAI